MPDFMEGLNCVDVEAGFYALHCLGQNVEFT